MPETKILKLGIDTLHLEFNETFNYLKVEVRKENNFLSTNIRGNEITEIFNFVKPVVIKELKKRIKRLNLLVRNNEKTITKAMNEERKNVFFDDEHGREYVSLKEGSEMLIKQEEKLRKLKEVYSKLKEIEPIKV